MMKILTQKMLEAQGLAGFTSRFCHIPALEERPLRCPILARSLREGGDFDFLGLLLRPKKHVQDDLGGPIRRMPRSLWPSQPCLDPR